MMVDVMPEPTHQGFSNILSMADANPPPSPKRLEGKVAIITGGAQGIGEAIVKVFAMQGAKVVIADIEDRVGCLLAESLGLTVSFIHCDVSIEEDIERLINRTISKYGRLDILVNNAGILGNQSKHKSILNFDPHEFDRVMGINVRGAALGIKHAARVMIPRGAGCIVSMASVAGIIGGMGPHAYTISKHALVGLTKNAACELGRYGIRVNCISPFGVATSMLVNAWRSSSSEEEDELNFKLTSGGFGIPTEEDVTKMEGFVRSLATLAGCTLKAKDIAQAALYLATDESSYVSGHNLVVDGGVTIARNCVGL